MERYYLGGYYLIKHTPIVYFGETKPRILFTTSSCFNQYVFDYWCLSNREPSEEDSLNLGLSDDKIQAIKKWAGTQYAQKKLKWGNNFSDLNTARTFKNLFFPTLPDTHLYAIYLSETDTDALLAYFPTENFNKGDFSLYHNLAKKIPENTTPNEEFIGYDFIGVEINGDFHSFYCHSIGPGLAETFSLQINRYGLFEDVVQPEPIRHYLNAPDAGVENVPWYIAKTKRIIQF